MSKPAPSNNSGASPDERDSVRCDAWVAEEAARECEKWWRWGGRLTTAGVVFALEIPFVDGAWPAVLAGLAVATIIGQAFIYFRRYLPATERRDTATGAFSGGGEPKSL